MNEATAAAQGSFIAYLPSDDVYYRDHLSSLAALLEADAAAIMASSGLLHHYNRRAEGRIDGYPLQLVQVLHCRCNARWLAEFSQYDAGWLHSFVSSNGGGLQRANWDDLNYPARIGTFAAAGIPIIQRDNRGAVVASQTLVRDLDIGLFYQDAGDLAAQLRDAPRMQQLRESLWAKRSSSALTTTSAASWPFSAKRCVIGASAGCMQRCTKATPVCRPCNTIHHKENKTCSII